MQMDGARNNAALLEPRESRLAALRQCGQPGAALADWGNSHLPVTLVHGPPQHIGQPRQSLFSNVVSSQMAGIALHRRALVMNPLIHSPDQIIDFIEGCWKCLY